ncbi:MAG: hypothetical protein ACPG21_13985 [Crocinitomicaceae bacterium]
MRLAQIARKVGKTPNEIARYLDENSTDPIAKDPNIKLTEDQVTSVLDNFQTVGDSELEAPSTNSESDNAEAMETVVAETIEEATPIEENEIPSSETEPGNAEEVAAVDSEEVAVESEKDTTVIIEEGVSAEADSDEEEFYKAEVEPDAELIKAPTVKLDGLKILGKIELPGDKKEPEVVEKTAEEIEAEESSEIAALDAAMQSQAQDIKPKKKSEKLKKEDKKDIGSESEYKDENGIYHFSTKQKANREKRLKEIALKKKRQAEKEKKRKHYESLVKDRPAKKRNKDIEKKKQKTAHRKAKKMEEKEAPKGLWQKFVHWLND